MKKPISLTEIYKTVPEGLTEGDVLRNKNGLHIMLTHINSSDQVHCGYVILSGRDSGKHVGQWNYEMKDNKWFAEKSLRKVIPGCFEEWEFVGKMSDLLASFNLPF